MKNQNRDFHTQKKIKHHNFFLPNTNTHKHTYYYNSIYGNTFITNGKKEGKIIYHKLNCQIRKKHNDIDQLVQLS